MLFQRFDINAFFKVEHLRSRFSPLERWLFISFTALALLGALGLAYSVYTSVTLRVPGYGGSITEGVVGAPRFVNPVLAVSQTDKDLTEMVYAGLLTTDPSGSLVPELAESYTVSDNALVYTFTLKDDLSFHDGTPLTAEDVAFTVRKALDPAIKSPERVNWEGVTIDVIDEQTLTFTLSKPYAQFIQNATMGILPEEHWSELSADEFIFSQLNTEPVGAGPFAFSSARLSASGIPERFVFNRFNDYTHGKAYLKTITVNFYHNEGEVVSALENGAIDTASEISAQNSAALNQPAYRTVTTTLPRIFAVFFNPGRNEMLQDRVVRTTLRDMIDSDTIISELLSNHAQRINGPLLRQNDAAETHELITPEAAREILAEAGYSAEEPLSFTLATANTEELKAVATFIANTWSAAGVDVKLEVFEAGDLSQSVLRTREYDALLFGEVIGTFPDPYAFWHSSQVRDPGLNIALYANAATDKLLMQARNTVESDERDAIYADIVTRITGEVPAVFLYAPDFIYLAHQRVKGIVFPPVMEPHERFAHIHQWHIDTRRMWDLLVE